MDVEGIHWLYLVSAFRCVRFGAALLILGQILVGDVPGERGHTHAEAQKVEHYEAKARDDPFKKQRCQAEAAWIREANQEGAQDEEGYVDCREARVVSMPLVPDLF